MSYLGSDQTKSLEHFIVVHFVDRDGETVKMSTILVIKYKQGFYDGGLQVKCKKTLFSLKFCIQGLKFILHIS